MVAQVLLSGDDIHDPQRSTNVKSTIQRLLELHALPILNENDAVSTEEIGEHTTIGENDTLAAQVAVTMGADLLVILSDINGLYTADPHTHPEATLITEIPPSPRRSGPWGGASSKLGTGDDLQAPGRRPVHPRRVRHGDHQRLPAGAPVRHCGGQACGQPLPRR